MVDPASALLVFAALSALAGVLLWPDKGLMARLYRVVRRSDRVLLEDALKHVYMCERREESCTPDSLAGRLEVSTSRAAELLSRLAEAGFVRFDHAAPEMTEDGRQSALRLVRSHRLWERYLADRTGVPAGEWHEEAERMEHALTPEETDELAFRLGYPFLDPHGDPIPTSQGQLPPPRVLSLLGAEVGRTVEIVHLEDEPRSVYDKLLADGMAPGLRLGVIDRTDNAIIVQAEGREWSVGSVAARNITIRYLPHGDEPVGLHRTLRDVEIGEPVVVVAVSSSCQGTQRRRLLDLGVVPGTEIVPELRSASGDPVAYMIRGALIGLRREQAEWILVKEAEPADAVTVGGAGAGAESSKVDVADQGTV
jgi:DtxR family Mn-dependent transcriptional regulator